jgi:hypothetical protein
MGHPCESVLTIVWPCPRAVRGRKSTKVNSDQSISQLIYYNIQGYIQLFYRDADTGISASGFNQSEHAPWCLFHDLSLLYMLKVFFPCAVRTYKQKVHTACVQYVLSERNLSVYRI